jgi:tripartite-type tricarboxylate transporter receptor subunit TctC
MLTRRHLIALSAAPALAPNLFIRVARAQTPKADFPNKPVRLIVPVAAGGPTDIVARMLAEKLSKMWGQQVVVENKGGAGTNIGNEYVAQSDPDGYTVLFATASLAVNTSLYRSLNYDPTSDFAPVSLVTQLVYFVFVPNSSPAHSMKEFIDYAKSRPSKLTIASPGTGSAPYLAEMLFLQIAAPRPPSPTSYQVAWTAISAAAHCCPTHGRDRFAFWRPRGRNGMRPPPTCRPSPRRACRVTT